MNQTPVINYNFKDTLMGGQSFTWKQDGDTFWGVTSNRAIKLQYIDGVLNWQTYPQNNDEDFLRSYLRLDVDYEGIMKEIKKDEHVTKAIEEYPHLRLLKQDFELTVLTFLVSANNNIKSIRRSVHMMCEKFGEKLEIDGKLIHLFPSTEVIAELPLKDLLSCSLGFRAKFIKAAARHMLDTRLAETIKDMDEPEARAALMEMNGVGPKITDCIMVFSLCFDELTPMDVWGKRILTDFYGQSEKMKYDDMRNWIIEYFEGKGAWAGQFLFEYIRTREQKPIKKVAK